MADSFITLGTRLDSASLQATLRQINSAITQVERRGVNVSVDSGKFTRPLGKITGATNEFTRSLEASNARVLAFGASAGAIFQVQRAFEFLLKSTIEVEKRLQDVNVILGQTDRGLAKFGNSLFTIAQKTAQSFDTVAEAATELARQGLSTEETLQRTSDALILTRLSGMDAAASVSSLTAALNTFNREALSSTQVINKLANVDAAFAVSTDDLAQSMRRVGSTAQDVGVSFDQLLAITASVQQTTARGGPVIGNALKSIFTRIQRKDTLNLLEELGVKVRDLEGQMMPAMNVLGNLAKKFPTLSKAQQAHTAEVTAGVFQMNNLRAILSDLGQEYSIYDKAVKVSTGSTNEAILRNELLNKTLDAQVKKTMALATQAAKKVGDLTLRPVTERVVGVMQKVLGDINEKDTKDVGGKIAQGMLSGIGNFLQGPGLLLLTGFLGKLGMNLAKFVKESGAQFMGLNTAAVQQKSLQEGIAKILEAQPQLIARAAQSSQARVQVEREIIAMLEQETLVMQNMEKVAARMAGMMVKGGVTVSGAGQVQAPAYMRGRPPKHSARGHIPNFNKRESAVSEIISAAEGGYKAGAIKQMKMPGLGTMTYNSKEQVKHVPGFAQPFINPPQHSKAGRQHREKSMAKTGVDPYSVPNFANPAMLSLFGRGKLGLGTVAMPGKGAAASLESFGIGRFHKSGPKVPKGQKNVLRTAYDHAISGHGVSAAKGKIALGEIGEVAVARATMPSDVAKRFYNDLLSPAVGKTAYKGFVDSVGGAGNASRIAQDIVYHPSGTARSFLGARERAMEVLGNNPAAKGSFFAKAELTHSSLIEKALVGRGSGHQLLPFSNVKGGQGETILDAIAIKGGKIIGPAEFKPSFHAGMSGRDARGSLSYKSLFSSDSGKEGGLLHFLRTGIEKNIARGGYKDKAGTFHSPQKLQGDLTKLDNYIDTAKTADFQRMQRVSQSEVTLEGAKGATQIKDIFGKDIMKILQGSPSASNYDKLMTHFGAAQGFIPNLMRGGSMAAAARGRGKGNIFDFDGTLGVPPKGMVTTPTGMRKMREGDTWHGWSVGHMVPTKLAKAASKNKEPMTVLTARGEDSIPYIQTWLKAQKIPYREVIATGSRKYPKGIEKTHQKKAYEIFERPHLQNAKFYEDSRANAYYAALRGASKDMNIRPRIVNYGSNWGQVNPAGQGLIPSFSKGDALADAFRREKKATGLPENQLYAASIDTPEYKGLAVGNKRDERTKADLIKAVRSHPDPAKAGSRASGGYIPNYAADSVDYMAMTSGMMMAGMMMQMGGDSAQETKMLADQKADHEKQKDIKKKAKAAAKKQERARKAQQKEKTRLQTEVKEHGRDAQKATKSRMEAKFGTRTTPGGERTGGVKQAEAAQQKAADRIVRREVNRAIMHGTPGPRGAGMAHSGPAGLGMTGLRAERGTVGGVPGINPSTGLPHTPAYNAKIEKLRQQGHAQAGKIISQSVDTSGRTPRGSVGEHSGDKAAKDLTKKTLLLQKAREAEARAADRANAANEKKAAAQAKIWAMDKKMATTSRKVAAAKHAEAKAAEKAAALKPDTKGAASKWIKQKGFGLGIGIQMMAGVAEQFVGGKGETPEERAEKAKVRGVGTAAGMAGTGAMIGGPWGAAAGLAIGAGLAFMDHQKASKKTAEDYAKAIQKETEARKKALLGAEAYIKLQGRLTGMFNRGAGPAETGMMRRQMREQLMQIEDAGLRRELIGAAGDESKMREAMAKVQETISMQEKKGSMGVLAAKAGEGGAAQRGVMKDLAKTLSSAFELKGIKSWELMGKSGADLTAKLEEMGVGAKEAADMIEALGEENQGLIPQIMAQARGYEELEAETSKSVESIERMALATADLNYRLSQISNSFEHLMNVSKSLFDHSQKVSKELSSAVTGDETIGRERRERFGVAGNILKNIETNTLKNTLLQKRFHDAILKMTMEKSSAGGSLPGGLQQLQVLARQMIVGPADLAADIYRGIINDKEGGVGREQGRKLEDALSKAEYEIKENNLNLAQSNRLLIIQNQIAESNRAFQRRRTLQESMTAGGGFGGGGIIDALKKLTTVAGLPTRGERSKAAMMQMQGLRDLEKMGFDFANGIGKAMKESLLERTFRAEAPDALEALGMSPENVSRVINSNFNPDIGKSIIESMNSAQGGMMAEVMDSANLSKIASEERAYKAKLLEAEFKNRNMLVESLGANVDVTALLIGSNYDLIVSNEKLGSAAMAAEEFGANQRRTNDQVYKAAIDTAMTGAVSKMGEIMSKANTGFMQAVEVFRGEQSLQHTRINQEKAFASLEGKTAGAEDMMANLSKGTKFSMVPPQHEEIFDKGGILWSLHKANTWLVKHIDAAAGSLLPGESMTWENITEKMDVWAVSKQEVKDSSFDINMAKFMERVRTGGNAEDVGKMTVAFEAYKSTLTDANVPQDSQMKISLVRAQEALLRSFARISEVTEEQGLIERTELPTGETRVRGTLPLDLNDWEKTQTWMGTSASPSEAIKILTKDLKDMVFEGDSGNWQPNMISALSKLTDVVALLPGKKGFEAYELQSDPKKLLTALLAIQTAVIGVHPSQPGQIYTRGTRQVLSPGIGGGETWDQTQQRGGRTDASYYNEIPLIRVQQPLEQGEYEGMMVGVSDMMEDYRSAGKLLFTNFQKTFKEGRTVDVSEAKLIKAALDKFEGQEARIRKVLEGVALRTGDEEGFFEREGDIKPLLEQFDTITDAFQASLKAIIDPNKGIVVDKKLAEQIAALLSKQIKELKPFRSSTIDLGGGVPDRPKGGGTVDAVKEWTNSFSKAAENTMKEWIFSVNTMDVGNNISDALNSFADYADNFSNGMEILNATIDELADTELAISADPLETPLLAIQQSIDALSKLNSSENEDTKNALNNKEDIVINVLTNILEAILSDETVSKSQREEIKNALHLLPEQYKRAMDEIEGRSSSRLLRDKLFDLRKQTTSAPIPPPLIPGSMLAGQVRRGTEQTTQPLTTMARQTFGKYGRSFLRGNKGYQGPRSGLPSVKELLGIDPDKAFKNIPDPSEIDKMMKDVEKASPEVSDPGGRASVIYLTKLKTGSDKIHDIARQAAERLMGDNAEMIDEIHKLAPFLGDLPFQELEKGLEAANKDMSAVKRVQTAATQKASAMARTLGRHTMEMANVFINQNLLAAFRGPQQVNVAKRVGGQWMDKLKDAMPDIAGKVTGMGPEGLSPGTFEGGLFGGKLNQDALWRRAAVRKEGGVFTPDRTRDYEHSMLGPGSIWKISGMQNDPATFGDKRDMAYRFLTNLSQGKAHQRMITAPGGNVGGPPALGFTAAREHTILGGDTANAIAQTYGVSLDNLKGANPQIANINRINAGDKMNIPAQYSIEHTLGQKLTANQQKKIAAQLDKQFKEGVAYHNEIHKANVAQKKITDNAKEIAAIEEKIKNRTIEAGKAQDKLKALYAQRTLIESKLTEVQKRLLVAESKIGDRNIRARHNAVVLRTALEQRAIKERTDQSAMLQKTIEARGGAALLPSEITDPRAKAAADQIALNQAANEQSKGLVDSLQAERDALLEASAALEKFSKAIGISSKDLQDMSPFELDQELIRQEGLPRENLLQQMRSPRTSQPGGAFAAQTFSAISPSRVGETQQRNLKREMEKILTIEKEAAAGGRKEALAESKVAEANVLKAHMMRTAKFKDFEKSDAALGVTANEKKTAEDNVVRLLNEKAVILRKEQSDDTKEELKKVNDDLEAATEASALARKNETNQLDAHNATYADYINIINAGKDAENELRKAKQSHTDALNAQKVIIDNWGSVTQAAIEIQKRFVTAEHVKRMEALDTQIANTTMSLSIMDDPKKFKELLNSTKKLTEVQLRLAAKQARLEEAAGIGTPADTYQREQDITRQQLRTGKIGVWEAFGADTFEKGEAMSRGWKERVLDDMIEIREGMISSFADGWAAFAVEGESATETAKAWARGFLKMINQAFYNATIGRFMGNLMSGGFGNYGRPSLPQQQSGGELHGPSHSRGGIKLEAEGGEFIVRKSEVRKPGVLGHLREINEGRMFQQGGPVPQNPWRHPNTWAQQQPLMPGWGGGQQLGGNLNLGRNPLRGVKVLPGAPGNPGGEHGQFAFDKAPPAFHEVQSQMEMQELFRREIGIPGNPFRHKGTPKDLASQKMRNMRRNIAEGGYDHEKEHTLLTFAERIGVNGLPIAGFPARLNEREIAAREELQIFQERNPLAFAHLNQWWRKNKSGWANPQVYQDGGPVTQYQNAWEKKIQQRQMLQITGQIPSKGFFGQPLHKRGPMTEEGLREALIKSGRGDLSTEIPRGDEWYNLSKEALAKRAELEAEKKRMARINLEFRTENKMRSAASSSNRGVAMFAPPGMEIPRTMFGQRIGTQTRHTSTSNRTKDRATPGMMSERLWFHSFMKEKGLIGEFEQADNMGAFHQGNSQASRIYKFLMKRQTQNPRHILSEKELLDESMPELIPHIGDYNKRIFTEMGTSGLLMDPKISASISELDKIGIGSQHRWSENYALHKRLLKDRLMQGKGNAWYNKFIQAPNALPVGSPDSPTSAMGLEPDPGQGRWWNDPFAPLPKGMHRIPSRRNRQQGPSTPMPPQIPWPFEIDPATGLPRPDLRDRNSTMPGLGEGVPRFGDGGIVGTAYPWSDSPARKFNDKLPFWDRVDPRRRGFSRVGGSSGNNAFGPTAAEWGGARKDDPVRQQQLADHLAMLDRENEIDGMRDAGFGPFGMPLGGDPWPEGVHPAPWALNKRGWGAGVGPDPRKNKGNALPLNLDLMEELENLRRGPDRDVPQFGAGGVVTARDTFRAKVPKLDKNYIKKLANNSHILNWIKDPNNIERFGFTKNDTFESAYMKMIRHAEKIKLKPGKRMSQLMHPAGFSEWENGMQPGVANDMMAAGWIEPEAFGVLNEWFSIKSGGYTGLWGQDMTNFPGAAGEQGGGINAFFTGESERKDQQRALNKHLTSMGLMSPNPKAGQIKPLKIDGYAGAATTEALTLFRKKKGIPTPTRRSTLTEERARRSPINPKPKGPHRVPVPSRIEGDKKTREALGMVVGYSGMSKAGWKGRAPSGFLTKKHFKSKNRAEVEVHPYTGLPHTGGFDPEAKWELDPKNKFFDENEGFPSRYEIIPGKGLGHVVKVGEGLTSIGQQYREEMTTAKAISMGANGVTISAALAAANPELMKALKTRAGGKPDISKFLKPNDVVLIPGGEHLFNPEADKRPGMLDGKPFPGFRQGWWEQFNKMSTIYGTMQPVEYGAGGFVWNPRGGGSVPNQFRRQSALEIPATGRNQTLLPKHQAWNNRLRDFWRDTYNATAAGPNRLALATERYRAGIHGHMAAPRVRATRGAHGVSPGGYRYTRGPEASTLVGGNIDRGGVARIGPPTAAHRNAMRNRGRYFQREETPDFAAWGVHPSAVDKDVARVIFSEVGPQHPDLVFAVGDAMRNRYNNQASRTRHGISTGYGISVGGSRYPAEVRNGAWWVQAPTRRGFSWRAAQPGEATTASEISMRDIAWQGAPGGFKPTSGNVRQAQQFSAIGDADNDNWHLSGRLSVFQQSPQGFNDMNTWLSGGDAARAVTERYRTHYGSDVLGNATNGWIGAREDIQNVWKKSLEQSATDKRLARGVTVPGQRQSGLLDSDEEWYKSWQIPMGTEFNSGMKPTAMTQNIGPFWMWRPDYTTEWQSRANDKQRSDRGLPTRRGRVAPERRQRGGLITAGSGTTDDVPVYLKKGEMVMTQKAVKDNGVQYFKDIEAGRIRMEEGGEVDEELIQKANEATEENQESEGEETGERNPPSLNEKYGDNLAEAWQGSPGGFKMEGIATQDKKWYNSGNMPGEGMTRVAEVVEERFGKGFKYGGTNAFAVNDPDKPSLGRFFVDHKMSAYAMGDKNNKQNEMREKRRKMFVDYKIYLKEEYENRKEQWDEFKTKKKQMLTSAWIQFAVAAVQVGVAAKSQSANKKYGTDQQVADNPAQFKSMDGAPQGVKAGDYVNQAAHDSWAKKMKWADSPVGSSVIAGGSTALIGWGMGLEKEELALTAGTAAATAAITSYAKIKGLGKAEQNALNSSDPAVQQAALDRWKKHLKPEEITAAEQSIAFHGTETQLKQWVKEENKAQRGIDKWTDVINESEPGGPRRALAEKTAKAHADKLRHVQAGKQAFLANSQALHPGLLEKNANNVWGMNDKERANLKAIKLGWARSKEAATVRRNQLEGMNENEDMLGRMLKPGGNMGGFPVPRKAQGGLITDADGPPGEDTIKALLTRGEFVISKEGVDQFPGGANALLKYNDIAKHGGQVARFAEGGMVGRQSQFAPTSPIASATGGALGLNVGQGAEGMTDSLMQLVDIVQSIRDTVDKETDEKQREKRAGEQNGTQDGTGGVNQEITNNVAVTVNVNSDGTAEATASSSSEGGNEGAGEDGEDDADKHERFAELMQGVVLQTIVEEQRPGGLLYKKG